MIDRAELYEAAMAGRLVLKIELDHHLEADSGYFGDPDYRLVYEASSTCEIIGRLAIKMERQRRAQGEVSDRRIPEPQPGAGHPLRDDRGLADGAIPQVPPGALVLRALQRLLRAHARDARRVREAATSRARSRYSRPWPRSPTTRTPATASCRGRPGDRRVVGFAVLDPEASRFLFATYGNDTAVAVAKALVDKLAEESGRLGLVGYYDDPAISPFAQFRLRRARALRPSTSARPYQAELTNGGGHPGAVGFRIPREAVPDIDEAVREFARVLSNPQASAP